MKQMQTENSIENNICSDYNKAFMVKQQRYKKQLQYKDTGFCTEVFPFFLLRYLPLLNPLNFFLNSKRDASEVSTWNVFYFLDFQYSIRRSFKYFRNISGRKKNKKNPTKQGLQWQKENQSQQWVIGKYVMTLWSLSSAL